MKEKLLSILSIFLCFTIILSGCGNYTNEDVNALKLRNEQLQNSLQWYEDAYNNAMKENEMLSSQLKALQIEYGIDIPTNSPAPSEIVPSSTPASSTETTISESIIYSDNDVVITIHGYEEKSNTINISFLIENNSSLNLGFNAHAYAINGLMTGNNIYDMDCDVAAGKKANAILEIEKDFLTEHSILDVASVDVLFWAYDNDKYYKEFDTNQITIYTNHYNDTIHKQYSGTTIYDSNNIQIDYLSSSENKFTYCITNNSADYFSFDVENITVNDYTSSDLNFDLINIIVLNSCQAIFTVEINNQFLDLNNISEINKVEFTLNIRPLESYFSEWSTDMITTQITLN